MRSFRDYRLPGKEISPDRDRVSFPNDSRMAVLFTIDCYGSEAASNHHMIGSTLDYGPERGLWRLLDQLESAGLKATVNIAGATAHSSPRLVRDVFERGHDIGMLGYQFEPHWKYSEEQEREAIGRGIAAFQAAIGITPKGWRTPQSRPSRKTLSLLAEAGFLWDSSLRNDEIPYGLVMPSGRIIEIPCSGVNDDTSYVGFPYPIMAADSLLSIWRDEFEMLHGESSQQASMVVYSLTPGFMGRRTGLSMIEDLVRQVQGKPGVWFPTCTELASWWTDNNLWKAS